MASSHNKVVNLTIFGESHGVAIGGVLEGLPAGECIHMQELQAFVQRRASHYDGLSTPRKETDEVHILSGMYAGKTTGTPLAFLIKNEDLNSRDYDKLMDCYRPGHADYTGEARYCGYNDPRGGGHFSGRLTAPLVVAGGICKQILLRRGVVVGAHVVSIHGVCDELFSTQIERSTLNRLGEMNIPVLCEDIAQSMRTQIELAKAEGDSVGGVIECAVIGLETGLGSPMFDGIENRVSSLMFAIPAVKGIEFGLGFDSAELYGSENNDVYAVRQEPNGRENKQNLNCQESNGSENKQDLGITRLNLSEDVHQILYPACNKIQPATNHHGGILGGISSGMPIVCRVAIKPTPSIAKSQQTVDKVGRATILNVTGRHDPCIVVRAVPCVESVLNLVALDLLCEGKCRQL